MRHEHNYCTCTHTVSGTREAAHKARGKGDLVGELLARGRILRLRLEQRVDSCPVCHGEDEVTGQDGQTRPCAHGCLDDRLDGEEWARAVDRWRTRDDRARPLPGVDPLEEQHAGSCPSSWPGAPLYEEDRICTCGLRERTDEAVRVKREQRAAEAVARADELLAWQQEAVPVLSFLLTLVPAGAEVPESVWRLLERGEGKKQQASQVA
jgi:hypothetical protein